MAGKGEIVKLTARVAVEPLASVRVTEKDPDAAALAVPVSAAVVVLSAAPAGSAPAVIE